MRGRKRNRRINKRKNIGSKLACGLYRVLTTRLEGHFPEWERYG
jgi:hypothetical protein